MEDSPLILAKITLYHLYQIGHHILQDDGLNGAAIKFPQHTHLPLATFSIQR